MRRRFHVTHLEDAKFARGRAKRPTASGTCTIAKCNSCTCWKAGCFSNTRGSARSGWRREAAFTSRPISGTGSFGIRPTWKW